jgi:hypothetical protein
LVFFDEFRPKVIFLLPIFGGFISVIRGHKLFFLNNGVLSQRIKCSFIEIRLEITKQICTVREFFSKLKTWFIACTNNKDFLILSLL